MKNDVSVKRAVIFTGGFCSFSHLSSDDFNGDLIIAADAGRITAEMCGVHPGIIVGDFDSSPIPAHTTAEIIRVPAEKDDTDTMLACRIAIERGATELYVIGGTGGRLDHTLSNVFFLEALHERGVRTVLTDGVNRLHLLKDETVALSSSRFTYFSLFALDSAHVTLEGCKYPLDNALLSRDNPYAVSNEITTAKATISVSGGAVLLVESDAR